MDDLEKLIDLLDAAEEPDASSELKHLARTMLTGTKEYARELPLVNVDTGENKTVRSDYQSAAHEKAARLLVESRGAWEVDYEKFERWLRDELQQRKDRYSVFRWFGRKLAATLHGLGFLGNEE